MPRKKVTRRTSRKTGTRVASQGTAPARTTRERKRRVPFGGFQQRLSVSNKDPNYFYYWQKDTGDNLQRMLDAGYEFVTKEQAGRYAPETLENMDLNGGNQSITDRIEVYGGSNAHGDEFNLVLMRQPMEWHLEDQAELEKRNLATDEAIHRGQYQGDSGDNDETKRYGDINVTVRHEE